jgi:hypothetical protein
MRGLVALALAAGALVLPSQAAAAGSAAPELVEEGFYTLETGEVAEGAQPAPGRTAFPSRCKRVWAARVFRNFLGIVLWKYFQQQGFCYNGSKITSLYDWRRWPEVYSAGWDFKGHIGRSKTGGVGRWHYGTWTQGEFALCAAWCLGEKHPWVDIDVYGNGGWSHKTGGT